MNSLTSTLASLSSKNEKLVLGLMSGTSMDGLDLALCRITGHGANTEVDLLAFSTRPYTPEMKEQLQDIVSVSQCSLEDVCLMNSVIGNFTGRVILEALEKWEWEPADVDCVASHGQTIYHAPVNKHERPGFPHATLQIGDGDHIAQVTGIPTISDFRQKHTAAGGEGAPMVAPVDRVLFTDAAVDRLLLNIGGIANFTYLPAVSSSSVEVSGDTGPGNTLMDKAARRCLSRPFDQGGAVAREGTVNEPLLSALKADPYFDLELPKTTGPERFNWEYVSQAQRQSGTADLKPEDLLATLTLLTADTIAEAVAAIPRSGPLQVLVSGGGIHNHFLMDNLEEKLPETTFSSFSEQYFNADAKEAVCFAVLANETLSGKGFHIDPQQPERKLHFGKISVPDCETGKEN
ncbi:anhydro-N-acetylmuramic acid kinase [Fodinibius sediminis]|uniref:Anhydro-N-acetylmuramic acid kinase n=1 Tax=Fodinibius sediminis TaxID=1214077 RepID=A0A521CDA2_9BACT|nr:anhydro-N-acetylmuramic acid kinase [Fodinibius sediminis]SMO56750.1 anhydro-N-acetylmuramic acid kinase [Fodinibius sediminis]